MAITKNGDLELNQAQTSRRRFLARNVLAIGVILATSAVAKAGGYQGGNSQGGSCFLKGTKIRTAEGTRKVEDLAAVICCRRCSAECAPFSGSRAMLTRRAIPLSHGHGTPAQFASPVRLSPPVFRTLIFS